MNMASLVPLVYILASVLFAFGLKFLGSPETARRGNQLSALGMLLAVVATLAGHHIIGWQWILLGLAIGSGLGALVAVKAAMTQMPEMVALLHGCGALASVFVDWVHYEKKHSAFIFSIGGVEAFTLYVSIVLGALTFTGSLIAWAKLSERMPGRPITFPGQQWINGLILLGILVSGVLFLMNPVRIDLFYVFLALSALFGIFMVIPIGGADMPVVISVLNSYSGVVACTTGFVINNTLLIVVGALVGANGIILSIIMCKAMNRSLGNVLFGAFGAAIKKAAAGEKKEAKSLTIPDAFLILEAARSVVITPGYGLAVAQAQHAVRELDEQLEKNGAEVRYAIHPVAGRMPGHMNVLLAEANIPYDKLLEMEHINPTMENVDVCIVIGANDTVNPAALHDKTSPIYGMPIIETFKAKTVFVIKRSMAAGFAGIENELFYYDNTRMIFGDAKDVVQKLVAEFKTK
ncbi:MAG: NAD(P)(+) transhydrogenase (Re/Si-specific) subunit beta [Candidatus Omnitrophica bacterium]|nr:NAD(P)(+) transhydrogenase (Re/Si-specific) subunit beta [Candidatus Omnitrophota bacterium]